MATRPLFSPYDVSQTAAERRLRAKGADRAHSGRADDVPDHLDRLGSTVFGADGDS